MQDSNIEDLELLKKQFMTNFPARWISKTLKVAGKILKEKGLEAWKKYLEDNYDPSFVNKSIRPPAKCNILAISKSLEELSIFKVSQNIQKYIYSLTIEEENRMNLSKMTSKDQHSDWFASTFIDDCGYRNVQGLNLIFNNVDSIYKGVLLKVENRNKKKKKGEELELASDEKGYLLQPPGINNNIYCSQGMSVSIVDINNKKHINILKLCPQFENYKLKQKEYIPTPILNRLEIPYGKLGYIPEWQREKVNKKKQRIRAYSNGSPILGILFIDEDWVIFDVRGLLRNVMWRKLSRRSDITSQKLLDLFSADPVIDVKRNIITFLYGEGVTKIKEKRQISYKKAPDFLIKKSPCCLVSIDLGQNVPVATRVSQITNINNELFSKKLGSLTLDETLLSEIKHYRNKSDQLNEKINKEAFDKLNDEQQKELKLFKSSDETKQNLYSTLNIESSEISWNEMGNYTFFIKDYLETKGVDVYYLLKDIDEKIKKGWKASDFNLFKEFRLKVSKETREELSKYKWGLQITSDAYKKLSKQKQELARRCINYIIKEARKLAPGMEIVLNYENLNLKDNFFSGSGKRELGWDNFFINKKENRWLINVLHKTISELPANKGMNIIGSESRYTSQTCPNCQNCDKENRNGIEFKCLKCDYKGHSDLDVATFNLEKVAINGIGLPKPLCEQLGGEKKPVVARKAKPLKIKEKREVALAK